MTCCTKFLTGSGIDYVEIYSLVICVIMFQISINLVVSKRLNMCLTDMVITYLYGLLDADIYSNP